MATRINSNQILDETIRRADLNATTTGQAVIKKLVQGTNVSITSTGVDSGTGDVTVSVTAIPWNIVTGRATTLAGYGITDAYNMSQVDSALSGKANKATTLSGYGITDAYTKTQLDSTLNVKADKATTLSGYGITDAVPYTGATADVNLGVRRLSGQTLTHTAGIIKTGEYSGYGGTYILKNSQSYSAWGAVTGAIGYTLNSHAAVVKVTFKIAAPSWNAVSGFQTLEVGLYEGDPNYGYANLTNPTSAADVVTSVRIGIAPDGKRTILINQIDQLWNYPMVIVEEVLHGGQAAALNNWPAPTLVTSYAPFSSIPTLTLTSKLSNHTHTFASLTSKPSTLAGYGITDAADGSFLSNRPLDNANDPAPKGVSSYYLTQAASNKPSGTDHAVLKLAHSAPWSFDIAGDWRTDNMYIRGQNNGVYGPWRTVWHSGIFDAGNAIQYGMIVQNRNSFRPKRLYNSQINNALFLANKRFTVTGVIYNADNSVYSSSYPVESLFNGNYEDTPVIPAGKKLVLTINFGGAWGGYPYGTFYISYYYTNWAESLTARAYCTYEPQGVGWKTLTVSDYERTPATQTLIQRVYNGYYGIDKVEFTITAPAGAACYPSEIEWALDRPTNEEMPYFDKLNANNVYAPFYFKDGANATKVTISGSDITADVPLTLTNGKDLIFKADDPGDILFQTSTGIESGRIWKAGSAFHFSLNSGVPVPQFTITNSGASVNGNTVWHAGIFNPGNYASLTNMDMKTYLKFADTRSENYTPIQSANSRFSLDFKYRATLGVPGSDQYGGLITISPWSDGSGGSVTQIFAGQDGMFYRRNNMSAASWTDSWHELVGERKYLDTTTTEKSIGWTRTQSGTVYDTYFFGNNSENRMVGMYDTGTGMIWNWSAQTNTFKTHTPLEAVSGLYAGSARGIGSWSTAGWGPSIHIGGGSHGILFPTKGGTSTHSAFIGKTADNYLRIMGKAGDDLGAPGGTGPGSPINAFMVDVSNGNAYAEGTMSAIGGFYQTSSREAKENIRPVEFNALEIVNATRIVNFNYINDETKEERIGFIAEDTPKELSGENQKQFRNSDTIAVLIKAVQELTARVEELENASE